MRIVVVTGHVLNDLLRLRLVDAGADELYAHADVRTSDALVEVMRSPVAERAAPPSAADLAAAGVSSSARPSDALRWVAANGMEGAFVAAIPQKALPASRRRLITARRRVSELMGLSGRRGRDGAEWREVVRVVNQARGEERRQR